MSRGHAPWSQDGYGVGMAPSKYYTVIYMKKLFSVTWVMVTMIVKLHGLLHVVGSKCLFRLSAVMLTATNQKFKGVLQ